MQYMIRRGPIQQYQYQPLVVLQSHPLQAYVYTTLLLEPGDTEVVMEDNFLINNRFDPMLFNYNASYSFNVPDFVCALGLAPKVLQIVLKISSLVGMTIGLRWAYRRIRINLDNLEFFVDVLQFPMYDIDMILDMD